MTAGASVAFVVAVTVGTVRVVECHSLAAAAMSVMMAAASFCMTLFAALLIDATLYMRTPAAAGEDGGALELMQELFVFDSHKRSFLVWASCTEAPCVTRL